MFTGIVTHLGSLAAIDSRSELTLRICQHEIGRSISVGDSISCNGICLTVIRTDCTASPWFEVQASRETIDKTNVGDWNVGDSINLERPLRVGDELGGHIVLGHIDDTAQVIRTEPAGDSRMFMFSTPDDLQPFIATKGSVAINGVSLTVNEVTKGHFTVNLIPHTLEVTSFSTTHPGDTVNLEIDPIARYVQQILATGCCP